MSRAEVMFKTIDGKSLLPLLMAKDRRKYALDFKLKVVALSNEFGSQAALAQRFNISMQTIKYWRYDCSKKGLTGKTPRLRPNSKQDFVIISLRKQLKEIKREKGRLERNLEKVKSELEIFKKGREYLSLKPRQKYQFIHSNKQIFSIRKMCEVFKIGTVGYYRWLYRLPTKQFLYYQILLKEVKRVFTDHHGRYGSRRIAIELKQAGFKTNQVSVCNMMRKMNLKVVGVKRYKTTTKSSPKYPIVPNRLMQNFEVTHPNEVWVSDITYIRIGLFGWLYLTTIIDLFDRKVIGWTLSKTMKAIDTTVQALRLATTNRPLQTTDSLIFHSDRGIQYACKEFKSELKKHKIILQSMSSKGSSRDNAVAESFFSTLKTELVCQNRYQTKEQAIASISDYIENYYNTNRRHSTLNYLTISEFNKANNKNVNKPSSFRKFLYFLGKIIKKS